MNAIKKYLVEQIHAPTVGRQKYIYMRKIKGKSVVDQLRNHVYRIDLQDFDPDKYLKSLNPTK